MCIVSLSRYSCPTFPPPIKSGSFKTKSLSVFFSWHCYFYVYSQPCLLYHLSWNLTVSSKVKKTSYLSAWHYLGAISGPPTFASSTPHPCCLEALPHSRHANTRRGNMLGPSIGRSSTGHGPLSFNACCPQGIHGLTGTKRPCASSGDNVGKGHTKDGPSDVASYHSRFALPVSSPEFGGCGLSKSKGTRTSGSWPASYSGKSPTVQHLADD